MTARKPKPAVKTLGQVHYETYNRRTGSNGAWSRATPTYRIDVEASAFAVADEFARRVKLWFPAWSSVAQAIDAVLDDARKEAQL